MARARGALLRAGYTLWSPVVGDTAEALLLSKNRQLLFTNSARGTAVDMHWGLLHEMFSSQLDVKEAFDAAQIERHENVEFLSLSPEHLLLYLCAHGAKNCWSNLCAVRRGCSYSSPNGIDWDDCIRLAEANGFGPRLNHTLLLCKRVLGIDLPEKVKQQFQQDEAVLLFSNTAESFLCLEGGTRPGYLRPCNIILLWRNHGAIGYGLSSHGYSLQPRQTGAI